VSAAREAIGDADFFLVARTDARGVNAKYGLEVRKLHVLFKWLSDVIVGSQHLHALMGCPVEAGSQRVVGRRCVLHGCTSVRTPTSLWCLVAACYRITHTYTQTQEQMQYT
jgi:hypothetical protein